MTEINQVGAGKQKETIPIALPVTQEAPHARWALPDCSTLLQGKLQGGKAARKGELIPEILTQGRLLGPAQHPAAHRSLPWVRVLKPELGLLGHGAGHRYQGGDKLPCVHEDARPIYGGKKEKEKKKKLGRG